MHGEGGGGLPICLFFFIRLFIPFEKYKLINAYVYFSDNGEIFP